MKRKRLVALTGAGISAESGLKTFRDSGGLWEGYRVEDVATPRAWKKDPARVLEFYNMRRKGVLEARPNKAHEVLAALQEDFDVHIITQNVDDLHERAGSRRVMHLHGEILRMRSEKDESLAYPCMGDIRLGDRAEDGAQLRPDIVWFEEPVSMIEQAVTLVRSADVFLLAGTSLAVYPAAGLMDYLGDKVPKYVVDRQIPPVGRYRSVIPVELPATEGLPVVAEILRGEG